MSREPVSPRDLEKEFDGKTYRFYTRHRSKTYVEADKGTLENIAENYDKDVSFHVVEREINNEKWYYLYRRYENKSSKRKTPITFRRGSTKSPVASSTHGPGKGWHGERVRHSNASIKGWRGRK